MILEKSNENWCFEIAEKGKKYILRSFYIDEIYDISEHKKLSLAKLRVSRIVKQKKIKIEKYWRKTEWKNRVKCLVYGGNKECQKD